VVDEVVLEDIIVVVELPKVDANIFVEAIAAVDEVVWIVVVVEPSGNVVVIVVVAVVWAKAVVFVEFDDSTEFDVVSTGPEVVTSETASEEGESVFSAAITGVAGAIVVSKSSSGLIVVKLLKMKMF